MSLTILVLVVIVALVILKIYLKLTDKCCTNKVSLVGRTVVVTGANIGIGYETALEFAKRGGRVILACRNEERANRARDQIIKESLNENVVVRIVDLGSISSVRRFAKSIMETENRLDILVNNAGLGRTENVLTNDGYRALLQANYLGPFLLTLLLLDKLKKTAPSRIINVSSIMAKYGSVHPHNLNSHPGIFREYSQTKLLNVLFTIKLAELLKPFKISVFSLHPGSVRTNIFRSVHGIPKTIINFVMNLFFKNSEEGAQTTVYTALEQGIEHLSGEHFTECSLTPRYPSAQDRNLVDTTFYETLELLKLTDEFRDFANKAD